VVLVLDPATSEFFDDGTYFFEKSDKSRVSPAQMVDFWKNLLDRYQRSGPLKMGSPKTITPGGNC